jgi:hypothetical protein
LEGIKSGIISLAFRKWNKLSVKKDSLIKTSVGLVQITDVHQCTLAEISEQDAINAGFADLRSLLAMLNKYSSGNIYRIHVNYYSADPRLALRAQTILTSEQLEQLKTKVERLDKLSKQGNWTAAILKVIGDNPKLKAADLAIKTGKEKDWLKLNIRKLKNLGLTISYEPGYTLSPLGVYFLQNS